MKMKKIAFALLLLPLMLSACAAKNDMPMVVLPVEELYRSGLKAFQIAYYDDAEGYLKRVMEEYPLTPEAFDAQLLLADIYYMSEKYEDAAAYYTTFYTFHPTHHRASYALFQKGMSHFKTVMSIDRDLTSTRKAYFAFDDLVKNYPESVYVEKASELSVFLRERLAARELQVGKYYFKRKNYKGALLRFGYILRDYPDTGLADGALYYIGESYSRLGETERARSAYETIVSEFPESSYAAMAKARLRDGG